MKLGIIFEPVINNIIELKQSDQHNKDRNKESTTYQVKK